MSSLTTAVYPAMGVSVLIQSLENIFGFTRKKDIMTDFYDGFIYGGMNDKDDIKDNFKLHQDIPYLYLL